MKTTSTTPIPDYGLPPKAGFLVKADERYPFGPAAILFRPTRRKEGSLPLMKAVRVNRNGTESSATASDIASVVNRSFFQNETQEIGWERLRLWLDGKINTHQAACWTLDEIESLFPARVQITEQPHLFAI